MKKIFIAPKTNNIINRMSSSLIDQIKQLNTNNSKNNVDELILKNQNINAIDEHGLTALFWAIIQNNQQAVKILLDAKSDPHIRNRYNVSPFEYSRNYPDTLNIILQYIDHYDFDEHDPLIIWAVRNNTPSMTDLIIKLAGSGYNINKLNYLGISALHTATQDQNIVMIRLIIELKGNPDITDYNGNTALHLAVISQNTQIIDILIGSKCDQNVLNVSKNTPLHLAVQSNNKLIVQILTNNYQSDDQSDHHNISISLNYCVEKYVRGETDYLETINILIGTPSSKCTSLQINRDAILMLYEVAKNQKIENVTDRAEYNELLILMFERLNDIDDYVSDILVWACLNKIFKLIDKIISAIARNKTNSSEKNNTVSINTEKLLDSALQYAVDAVDLRIIMMLICGGSDVNSVVGNGEPILVWATKNNYIDVVKLLIEKKCDMDKMSRDTALWNASRHGYYEIAEYLITSKCDLNLYNRDKGCPPIIIASFSGQLHIVKLLILSKCDIKYNVKGITVLNAVIIGYKKTNHMLKKSKIVKLLIENNCNIDIPDEQGLTSIFYSGYGVAKVLILYKCDTNYSETTKNFTPLIWTLICAECAKNEKKRKYNKKAKLLIRSKCNIDAKLKDGTTALMKVIEYGDLEMIRLLVEERCNINAETNDGYTALMHAVHHKDAEEIVKLLISKRCDTNVQNNDGNTALIIAILKKQNKIAQLLIDSRCHINLQNIYCNTALIIATKYNGNVDIIRLLIDKNANINILGNHKATALIWAVRMNNVEGVKILLDAKCNVDLQDENGWTALLWAVFQNNIDVINLLIGSKCCLEIKSNDTVMRKNNDKYWLSDVDENLEEKINMFTRCNALKLAIKLNRYEVVSLLIRSGCCVDFFSLSCAVSYGKQYADNHDDRSIVRLVARHCVDNVELEINRIIHKMITDNVVEPNVQALQNILTAAPQFKTKPTITIRNHDLLIKNKNAAKITGQFIDADIDILCDDGTPLLINTIKRSSQIIRFIEKRKKISGKDETVFFKKLIEERNRLVEILLDIRINVNVVDKDGNNALINSIKLNVPDHLIRQMVRLCDMKNHRNKKGKSSLYYSIKRGNIELVELFLDNGYHYHHDDLFCAIKSDAWFDGRLVEILLKKFGGVRETQNEYNLLMWAIVRCNDEKLVDMVRILLRYGCSPNYRMSCGDDVYQVLNKSSHSNETKKRISKMMEKHERSQYIIQTIKHYIADQKVDVPDQIIKLIDNDV